MIAVEPLDRLDPRVAGAHALVASGRGSLRRVLGEAEQRQRVLLPGLRAGRVLLAHEGGAALGFATLKQAGQGPFAPSRADFLREFGVGGLWRHALFHAIERRDARHPFYLYGMKVVPQAQRRGIASMLLDAVDEQGRKLGMAAVHLEVGENNARARALYEKHGYVVEARVALGPAGRWLPFDALLRMRRDLA